MSGGDVLFEFVQIGQQMRVAAIDEATGVEVVVIAPLNSSRMQMQRLAMAKLKRKIGRDEPPPSAGSGKYG